MDNTLCIVICTLILVVVLYFLFGYSGRQEGMSGYGVTSALAFNNRVSYCQEGDDLYGGSWSGGCSLPHRVII